MDLRLTTTTAASRDTRPLKSLSYTNGAPKHHPLTRFYPAPPFYRECLKNHAAAMGRHALDGCGEFLPSSAALTCAACGCHRNFHRRLEDTSPESPIDPSPLKCAGKFYPVPLGRRPAGEEQLNFAAVAIPATPMGESGDGSRERKRFRTKFSREQKEEMLSFSEKLRWKIQRADDVAVRDFCESVGVSRGVFKVWMHNNKNNSAKKDVNFAINSSNSSNFDGVNNVSRNYQNESIINGDGSSSST